MKKTISDRWLYLPVFVLGLYFIIRLINQSQLIFTFPLDYTNDLASYMAQLFFLDKCGFLNYCPYWYNGFISFIATSPGWYFFAYPIYFLIKNITMSTYISLILMYIVSFIFIYFIGKKFNFSRTKILAFFLFFFANAIAIGNFIRLGRIVSIFGFTMFLGLAFLVYIYKDSKLDWKFYFIIPLYSLLLMSHFQEAILGSFLILSLFLVKNYRDKIKIVISVLVSLLLISFWLVPFLSNLGGTLVGDYEGKWLWLFIKEELFTHIAATIIPLVFLILFYLYFKQNKSKKELLFYLPIIILAFLFLLRLTPFIPVFRNISPDPFILFFLFFSIIFIFNLDFSFFSRKFRVLFFSAIIAVVLLSTLISIIYTPFFIKHTSLEENTLDLLKQTGGRFIILGSTETSYSRAYYSYAPIYLDKYTADGWYPPLTSPDYYKRLSDLRNILNNKPDEFRNELSFFNVTDVIGYNEYCDLLNNTGLKLKDKKESVCLFIV